VENSQEITVKTYKYDGSPHRSWKGNLVGRYDDLMILIGVFEEEISHPKLGVIKPQTVSFEYYWFDRWYNVFSFHEPDGTLRNHYCNISMPPKFENDILEYVDLDIDVLVSPEFEMEIVDYDEFEQNTALYGYPEDVIIKTRHALNELKEMVQRRVFPFLRK